MSDDPYHLRQKSDHELYEWIAGWKTSTAQYIAGQQEIKRRNDKPVSLRSWIAIGIAALALFASILALVN